MRFTPPVAGVAATITATRPGALGGSTSLDDLMNRLDAAKRVSAQDASVVHTVTDFRNAVQKHQAALVRARKEQEKQVARRAAEKAAVERKLAAQQAYLSHIKG